PVRLAAADAEGTRCVDPRAPGESLRLHLIADGAGPGGEGHVVAAALAGVGQLTLRWRGPVDVLVENALVGRLVAGLPGLVGVERLCVHGPSLGTLQAGVDPGAGLALTEALARGEAGNVGRVGARAVGRRPEHAAVGNGAVVEVGAAGRHREVDVAV